MIDRAMEDDGDLLLPCGNLFRESQGCTLFLGVVRNIRRFNASGRSMLER